MIMPGPAAILITLALSLLPNYVQPGPLPDAVVGMLGQSSTPGELADLLPVLSVDFTFPDSGALVQAVIRAQEDLTWQVKVHLPENASNYDARHSIADVWIASPHDIGDIMGRWDNNRLAIIQPSSLQLSSPQHINSQWYLTDAALRHLAEYNTHSLGIPISGSISSAVYYRTDLPQQLGLQPDQLVTWAGLVQLVAALNATLHSGNSTLPQYPICWHRAGDCGGTLLQTMVAPIIQSHGTDQGLMVDVATGALLINSSATQLAIAIFQRLHAHSARFEDQLCEPYNQLFLSGRCAINLASAEAFKYYSQHPDSRVRGKFAVAAMPGSDVVLDRATQQLVPCNPLTCPQAALNNYGFQTSSTMYFHGATASMQHNSSSSSSSTGMRMSGISMGSTLDWLQGDQLVAAMPSVSTNSFNYSQLGPFDVLSGPLVNQAPCMSNAMVAVISKDLPTQGVKQALQLLANLTKQDASWPLLLDMTSGVTPFLYTHIDDGTLQGNTPQQWLDAGYDPHATQSYIETIQGNMRAAGNAAHELRVLGSDVAHVLQAGAAQQACQGVSPQLITQQWQQLTYQAISSLYIDMDDFVNEYRLSVAARDLVNPKVVPPSAAVDDSLNGKHMRTTTTITASVLGFAALVLAALWSWFAKRRKMDGLGRVRPPPKHPDTTLLVATLQDLEELHESCSAHVAGRAMAAWQQVTATLLREHCGYKLPSSTADTLHAAFYSPRDAAAFALRLHQQLLNTRWPYQLLHVPAFAPTFMQARDGEGSVHAGAAYYAGTDAAPGHISMPPASSGHLNTAGIPIPLSADHISGHARVDLNNAGQKVTGYAAADGHVDSLTRGKLASHEDGASVRTFGAQCAASWMSAPATTPTSMNAYAAHTTTVAAAASSGRSVPASSVAAAPKPQPLYSQATGWDLCTGLAVDQQEDTQVADILTQPSWPNGVKVSAGLQACVSLCAVCASDVSLCKDAVTGRIMFDGLPLCIAQHLAACGQAGMTLIPQQTFRLLPVEVMSETTLFCHYGEYQLAPELPAMDVYLALNKTLLARLARFSPLSPGPQGYQLSPGVLAAPVARAAMVFTHVVGVQALLSWNYDLTLSALEVFTRLAQQELKTHNGYLVEHVSGFMLSAFQQPAAAVLWALRLQKLMLKEPWCGELLSHELCAEVIVACPSPTSITHVAASTHVAAPTYGNAQCSVSSTCEHDSTTSNEDAAASSTVLFRGPRLKTGIDVGAILTALNMVTGRMAYRGKVMNRAARIAGMASSGQVLCSAEALIASHGVAGINSLGQHLAPIVTAASIAASSARRYRRNSMAVTAGVSHSHSSVTFGQRMASGSSTDAGAQYAQHGTCNMSTTAQNAPGVSSRASISAPADSVTGMSVSVPPALVLIPCYDRSVPQIPSSLLYSSQALSYPLPSVRPDVLPLVDVESLGLFQLKGIVERIEVLHCFYALPNLKVLALRPSMRSRAASRRNSTAVHSKPLHALHTGQSLHQGDGAFNPSQSTQDPSTSKPFSGPSLEGLPARGSGNVPQSMFNHANAAAETPANATAELPDAAAGLSASAAYAHSSLQSTSCRPQHSIQSPALLGEGPNPAVAAERVMASSATRRVVPACAAAALYRRESDSGREVDLNLEVTGHRPADRSVHTQSTTSSTPLTAAVAGVDSQADRTTVISTIETSSTSVNGAEAAHAADQKASQTAGEGEHHGTSRQATRTRRL